MNKQIYGGVRGSLIICRTGYPESCQGVAIHTVKLCCSFGFTCSVCVNVNSSPEGIKVREK